MAARSRTRFWTWYRAIPISAMVLVLLGCLVFTALPTTLTRQVFYPVHHVAAIEESASRHGIDPYLVCAVIKCESNWDDGATSDAGAVGLMQLLPSTAQEMATLGLVDEAAYAPQNLSDPATNIEYGCAYLAYLQSNTVSTDECIAAYNAGLTKVVQWRAAGTPALSDAIDYPETRFYLARVTNTVYEYQLLYPSGIDL